MAIDRNYWKSIRISKSNDPELPCPECGGVLRLVADSLRFENSGITSRHQQDENWEPDFWTGACSGILKCRTEKCSETIAMCGLASITNFDFGDGSHDTECDKPSFFSPPIHLFPIPPKCPKPVEAEIIAGFALFWCDKPGLMNHFRKALELIMDELRVLKNTVTTDNRGKRHRKPISLHRRIEIYGAKHPEMASHLQALKWLGNSGSHSGAVTEDDVFDACELLEHFIFERFENRGKQIRKITVSINRRRKPRSHSRIKKESF